MTHVQRRRRPQGRRRKTKVDLLKGRIAMSNEPHWFQLLVIGIVATVVLLLVAIMLR